MAASVRLVSLLTLLQMRVKSVSNAFMVLSNAERQARYRQRLKEAADRGVTPEMVVKAAQLIHETVAKDDPSLGSWEDALAFYRSRKGRTAWRDAFEWLGDPSDFGDDGPMMERVLAVVRAVLEPPLIAEQRSGTSHRRCRMQKSRSTPD